MNNNQDIVYFVWAEDDDATPMYGNRLCCSILSVKEFIPNSNIHVYLGDYDRFKVYHNFFKQHNVNVIPQKRTRRGYVNKLQCFSLAIKDLTKFIFLDADTIVCNYPSVLLSRDNPLLFTVATNRIKLRKTWKSQVSFLRTFGITKSFVYPSSCMIRVNQGRKYKPFWKKYSHAIQTITNEFLAKIRKEEYTPNLNVGRYNDELYFAIALERCGYPLQKHVVSSKITRSWMRHGGKCKWMGLYQQWTKQVQQYVNNELMSG